MSTEEKPCADDTIEMIGAFEKAPANSDTSYPTVEVARARVLQDRAQDRADEILARKAIAANMISIGPDDRRSVIEIARQRGLIPLVVVACVADSATTEPEVSAGVPELAYDPALTGPIAYK